MSLILRGSPTKTVYKQMTEIDVTSATAHSVYVKFIPSANASVPFVFVMDGDLTASPRGYSIKQNSPTSVTLGWLTSTGANEHTFTVESGVVYDVLSVYDRAEATIDHYVNNDTPVAQFASVGTPTDATKFNIRVLSSTVIGENITVGDLAIWNNGKPDIAALTAFNGRAYLGTAFKNSGCTDKYIFVGPSETIATLNFYNLMRASEYLTLEQESISTDPQSSTGEYLPTLATIRTQVASDFVDGSYASQQLINRASAGDIFYSKPDKISRLDILSDGVFDRDTYKFNFMPSRFEGMQEWEAVMGIRFGPPGEGVNPEMNTFPFVVEFDGSVGINVPWDATIINDNKYEFIGGQSVDIVSVDPLTGLSNFKIYSKVYETAFNSGRRFTPEAISYYSQYDAVRTTRSSPVTSKFTGSISDNIPLNSWYLGYDGPAHLPIELLVQMAIESNSELWWNVSIFLGSQIQPGDLESGTVNWETWGGTQYQVLDLDAVDEYFNHFVSILNNMNWNPSKRIIVETDDKPYKEGGGYGPALYYSRGIKNEVNSIEAAGLGDKGGIGYLSAMLMNSLKRALVAGGRASQVWTPAISVPAYSRNFNYLDFTNEILEGILWYIISRDTSLLMSDYIACPVVHVPEDYNSPMDFQDSKVFNGVTYTDPGDYYNAVSALMTTNEELLNRIYYDIMLEITDITYNTGINELKTLCSSYGIIKPLEECEGTSNNKPNSNNWSYWNSSDFYTYSMNYNKGIPTASMTRISIESFAINNPGGAIANTGTVGRDSTFSDGEYKADTWSAMNLSLVNNVLSDYTRPITDPATIWSNYLDYVDSNNTIEYVSGTVGFTLRTMTDGSWTTNPNSGLSVIGTPVGSGSTDISDYHDVMKFVRYPKERMVSITNVTSVVNGIAIPVLSGEFIHVTPSSASDMSMNVTITDDIANTITFSYNIDVT